MKKPFFGLVVLLTCPLAGLGGRAEAGFILPDAQDQPERLAASSLLDPRVQFGGTLPVTVDSTSSGALPDDVVPGPQRGPVPHSPRPGPAHLTHQTGGTTSSDHSSSGPVGAGGYCLIVLGERLAPSRARASLVLAEHHIQSSDDGSRLFRPPR